MAARRFVLLAAALAAAPAWAQPVTLDARAAEAIVRGCAAHAVAKKQSHAIAVVDTGGHVVAALRMDGNGSGIFDFALAKARAVAAWGFSTAQMAEAAKGTPGFAVARKLDKMGWRCSDTAELSFMFNNPKGQPNQTWTDVDMKVADQMSSYWVNFITKGDPNGNGLTKSKKPKP